MKVWGSLIMLDLPSLYFIISAQNFGNVLFKSLTIQGFLVHNLEEEYSEAFYNEIPGRIARGEIKYVEYVKHGLQSAGQLLVDVLRGDNFGKAVIVVADD